MPTVESAFNPDLAKALHTRHPRWHDRVSAEQTGVLEGRELERPDIVIRHPGGQPVIVETEFAPARTVEQEARDRLGATLKETGEPIEQTIAVVVPAALSEAPQSRLEDLIAQAEFQYCSIAGETAEVATRWPTSGWLRGGIDDLAGLIEQVTLSQRLVRVGSDILETGVRQAAGRVRAELQEDYPDALVASAAALHQEDSEQTSRMAMAIIANALTFHTAIANTHGIPTLDELRNPSGILDKGLVLGAWDRITRDINYYPIFKIAKDVLLPLPDRAARRALDRLSQVARDLDGIGATTVHDLSGQMFGELIADRKLLATFYTLPSSSALLAELAVTRLNVDWSSPDAIRALRVADFACGTGALLSATYRSLSIRHRRAGGDDAKIHRDMIEHALVGADIMPAATHLTASMLSSTHPTVTFGQTLIHTMPYGSEEDTTGRPIAIGSLSLIGSDTQRSLFGTGAHAIRGTLDATASEAPDAATGDTLHVPHESIDLVIMNPPFTRSFGHETAAQGIPISSFAGFDTPAEVQRAMAGQLKKLKGQLKNPAGHGYAGLASNFVDLAHQKVRPGGVLALVLPLTSMAGDSWSATRRLLDTHYEDILIATIAAAKDSERSFSADTRMGEVLVVASKRKESKPPEEEERRLSI